MDKNTKHDGDYEKLMILRKAWRTNNLSSQEIIGVKNKDKFESVVIWLLLGDRLHSKEINVNNLKWFYAHWTRDYVPKPKQTRYLFEKLITIREEGRFNFMQTIVWLEVDDQICWKSQANDKRLKRIWKIKENDQHDTVQKHSFHLNNSVAAFSKFSLRGSSTKFSFSCVCSIDDLNEQGEAKTERRKSLENLLLKTISMISRRLFFSFLSDDPNKERKKILTGEVNHYFHGRSKKILDFSWCRYHEDKTKEALFSVLLSKSMLDE